MTQTFNFSPRLWWGPAHAQATIVRSGQRLIVTAVDVTDVDRLAARSTLSFAVLERP
jgi:acyl-coenzyme A thioesterase PaaI-like protein